MPIDLHVWPGVHTHSRRLARAPGPGRGGSRRRAAGDRLAAGRQPRRRSRAAHAKDRRRRPAYTGVANGSYRRYVHACSIHRPRPSLSRFGSRCVCVCSQCATGYAVQARCLPRARAPAAGTPISGSAFPPQPCNREAHRRLCLVSADERHGRRRAFRGAIAVANVSCVEIRAPRSRAARRQLAAAIILRLFCSG